MRRWGTAAFHSAFLHILRGRVDQGLSTSGEVFRVGREGDDPQLQGWGRHGEGLALLCRGEMENAAAALEQAVTFLSRVPDLYDGCHAVAQLARCLLMLGKAERARPLIAEGRRMLSGVGLKGPKVAFAGAALAECCLLLSEREKGGGRLAEAGPLVRLSLTAARRFRGALPEALRVLGTFHHLSGRNIRAKRAWRKGLRAAEKLGAPWETAWLHRDIGRRTGNAFHLREAASLLAALGVTMND